MKRPGSKAGRKRTSAPRCPCDKSCGQTFTMGILRRHKKNGVWVGELPEAPELPAGPGVFESPLTPACAWCEKRAGFDAVGEFKICRDCKGANA